MIGVGGIDTDESRWDDCGTGEHGANDGARGTGVRLDIEVFAPAVDRAAEFPIDYERSEVDCFDGSVAPDNDGYGNCSGTSGSAAMNSGIVGLIQGHNILCCNQQVVPGYYSAGRVHDLWGVANLRQVLS